MDGHEELDSFETFLSIVARLRGPQGCPWDKKQTHTSLRKYLLEECHEALEALDMGDSEKIAEELGDVLLQVGLHSQIGADLRTFSIRDVLRSINEKLVRRHPHVFADAEVNNTEQVEANWEALKLAERASDARASVLDGIPASLPALAQSQKIQGRAAKQGFDWPDIGGVLDKVREEIGEFQDARSPEELEHELGDILASLVNVGRKLDIDTEGALRKANARFRDRFQHMELQAHRQGVALRDLPLEEQEALWQEAKRSL